MKAFNRLALGLAFTLATAAPAAAAAPFASFGARPSPILVPEAPLAPDTALVRLAQFDPRELAECRTDPSPQTERDCIMILRQLELQ